MIEAIEAGFFQKEIAEAIVSLSAFDRSQRPRHRRRQRVRARRRGRRHRSAAHRPKRWNASKRARCRTCARAATRAPSPRRWSGCKQACRDPQDNVMPHLIDCVNAYCTEGEIVEAMVEVYGRYIERSVF